MYILYTHMYIHTYILYMLQPYFEKDLQSWISGLYPTQTIRAYKKTFVDGEIILRLYSFSILAISSQFQKLTTTMNGTMD